MIMMLVVFGFIIVPFLFCYRFMIVLFMLLSLNILLFVIQYTCRLLSHHPLNIAPQSEHPRFPTIALPTQPTFSCGQQSPPHFTQAPPVGDNMYWNWCSQFSVVSSKLTPCELCKTVKSYDIIIAKLEMIKIEPSTIKIFKFLCFIISSLFCYRFL